MAHHTINPKQDATIRPVTALSIVAVDKSYELSFNSQQSLGFDCISNIFCDIQKLLACKVPSVIHVLTGPGSFTSTRIGVITAKTLALSWNIPIKSCTIIDCIPERLIFETGTQQLLVVEAKTAASDKRQQTLTCPEQTDFHTPFVSNSNKLAHHLGFQAMPNLLDAMNNHLANQSPDPDPQPYYALKPRYLA